MARALFRQISSSQKMEVFKLSKAREFAMRKKLDDRDLLDFIHEIEKLDSLISFICTHRKTISWQKFWAVHTFLSWVMRTKSHLMLILDEFPEVK